MRRCGRCKKVPRRDDALDVIQYDSGGNFCVMVGPTVTVAACRECQAEINGLATVREPTYAHGREYDFIVCGVCRLALRDDDIGTGLRLVADDVAGTGVRAGHYWSCRDCVERFKPRIYQRLSAHPEHYDPTHSGIKLPPLAHFGGEWLS